MMRSITVAFTLLLIGCASAAPDSNKAPSSEPEILITQLSNVAEAARHISGGISVQYRVDITNRAKEPITITDDPFKGDRKARVAVIEFSDYQCPFCGRYVTNTFSQIENDYVETGKVKYVFRDLPLEFHKNAFKAAEAAHCAGEQGKFWEMHDLLFQNQAALAPEQLPGYAKSLGLSEAGFSRCMESGQFAAGIKKDIADAGTVGITGTPTFLIGVVQPGDGRVKVVKKLVGAKPYEEFKAAIDSTLAAP